MLHLNETCIWSTSNSLFPPLPPPLLHQRVPDLGIFGLLRCVLGLTWFKSLFHLHAVSSQVSWNVLKIVAGLKPLLCKEGIAPSFLLCISLKDKCQAASGIDMMTKTWRFIRIAMHVFCETTSRFHHVLVATFQLPLYKVKRPPGDIPVATKKD